MLPYDLIQENPERKWHRQLLDRLVEPGVGEDELDSIALCLVELNDYRAVHPLVSILTNQDYSAAVREEAGYVLIHTSVTFSTDTLRNWWQTGDQVLQSIVLLMSGPAEVDLVLPVAQDPAHPLYIDGIRALEVGFGSAEYQAYVIDALQHPDPKIREVAASCLLWEEPLAAEEPLLAATEDPVETVVEAACDALQYYPTQRVFRRVSAMEGYSVKYIRDDLIHGLIYPDHQAHLRRWLAPIWDMLQVTGEEMTSRERGDPWPPTEPTRLLSAGEIEAFLDNPDSSPEAVGDFFREVDWLAVAEPERDRLVEKFVTHPDHVTREYATMALEKWQHTDGLAQLFHDSQFLVHKSATYELSQIRTPSRDVAAMLWEHLSEPDAWGTHSYETLDAYVAHADPDEARQRLVAMAEDRQQTETLRYHAVSNLQKLGAHDAIQHLLHFVQEPPSVTWGLHDILLDAAYELHLKPPPLTQYLAVDHAHIQTAIAPFVD